MLPSTGRAPGQAVLSGFEALPPQRPTDRLFFALVPDADSAGRIAALAERLRAEYGLKGRAFLAARLHVTLHLVGDYAGLPQRLVDTACSAAAALVMAPVEVAFDHAASFDCKPRNRPFVLRGDEGVDGDWDAVAALAAMQQAVGNAMAQAGLGRKSVTPGVPHMTLLYDDRRVALQAVEPIRWAAHQFVLMHSLLGRSRHVPIARWPLRG